MGKKLVIVIGDYSAGIVDDTLNNRGELNKLRSGDSADARVLSEMIRQDPSISKVVTIPIHSRFHPGAAGALTKEAVEFAFRVLNGGEPGYEDYDDVAIQVNVAPGIINRSGEKIAGNTTETANADREAFIAGTVTKGGKTVHIGSTNVFLEGKGHTLGYLHELSKDEYTVGEFKAVGGDDFEKGLKHNNQFRSRWTLAFMQAKAKALEFVKGAVDLFEGIAKEQHALLLPDIKKSLAAGAKKVFDALKNGSFLPVKAGDAKEGFVTIISESENIDAKVNDEKYGEQLVSGISYDGNEQSAEQKAAIAGLNKVDQKNYRETRQALLAANLANEFEIGEITNRTIVLDSKDSPLTESKYTVTLKNGVKIITSNPRLLALTTNSISTVNLNGEVLIGADKDKFESEAKTFREYLKDKAIENDAYGNVKLGATFQEQLSKVDEALKESNLGGIGKVNNDEVVKLTVSANDQKFIAYYVPNQPSSFGVWGHTKISSGSTSLDGAENNKDNRQAEFFTPGCATAGEIVNVIPGVTSFTITKAELIKRDFLKTPSTIVEGTDRRLHYDDIHATFLERVFAKINLALTRLREASSSQPQAGVA